MFSGSQASKLGIQYPASRDTSSRSEHIGLSDLNTKKIHRGGLYRNLRRAYFTFLIVGVSVCLERVHKKEDQVVESCAESQRDIVVSKYALRNGVTVIDEYYVMLSKMLKDTRKNGFAKVLNFY